MAGEKYVLAAGDSMTWTFGGATHRGVYLGNNRAFSLTSGSLEDTRGAEGMQHPTDAPDAVMPIVVLNSVVRMRTIIGGVFWGSLLSGLVLGFVAAIVMAADSVLK
jgi:hypothetical protein